MCPKLLINTPLQQGVVASKLFNCLNSFSQLSLTLLPMKKPLFHHLITFASILLSLVTLPFTTSAADKLNVLVITGGHGFEKTSFFKMFEENPEITFTTAEHSKTNATAYERTDLLTCDAVVLYDMPKEITDSQKEHFVALFKRGVGLVVLHHALC